MIITKRNMNNIVFNPNVSTPVRKSLTICADIRIDHKVRKEIATSWKGIIRGYISHKIRLGPNKMGTVVILYSEPVRDVMANQLIVLNDIVEAIEALGDIRREDTLEVVKANISTGSGLISCLGFPMHRLNKLFEKMHQMKTRMTNAMNNQASFNATAFDQFVKTAIEFKKCLKPFQSNVIAVANTIERVVCVASSCLVPDSKQFTPRNTNKARSYLQESNKGLVSTINEALLDLNARVPDINLLWLFRIHPMLGQCKHQTFYALMFLLIELIVGEWAPYASAAHITIDLLPSFKVTSSGGANDRFAMDCNLDVLIESVDNLPMNFMEEVGDQCSPLLTLLTLIQQPVLANGRMFGTGVAARTKVRALKSNSKKPGDNRGAFSILIPCMLFIDEVTKSKLTHHNFLLKSRVERNQQLSQNLLAHTDLATIQEMSNKQRHKPSVVALATFLRRKPSNNAIVVIPSDSGSESSQSSKKPILKGLPTPRHRPARLQQQKRLVVKTPPPVGFFGLVNRLINSNKPTSEKKGGRPSFQAKEKTPDQRKEFTFYQYLFGSKVSPSP